MQSLCLRDPHDHERPVFKAEIEAVDSNITMPTNGISETRLFVLGTQDGIGWVLAYDMWVTEDLDRSAKPGIFEANHNPFASEVAVFVTPGLVHRRGDART